MRAMMSSSIPVPTLSARNRMSILGVAAACVLLAGIFAQDWIAYLCVAIPSFVPLYLWIRTGARGIPVLPAISGLYFIYYAGPLLRSEVINYGNDEIVDAAATVGIFLLAAAFATWPFLTRPHGGVRTASQNFAFDAQIVRLVFVGLAGGILYLLASISGYLDWLGNAAGLLRSVLLTLTSIACYLLGYARAAGLMTGQRWVLALVGFVILTFLSFSSLLMIGGVMNGLAAVLGYVITARRIPWIGLGVAFAMLSVLHAGKFEMRNTYWAPRTQTMQESSVFQIPSMMTDWITAGVGVLAAGGSESSLLERASLLHMLLLAQRATPNFIPFLEGQTYAMLPAMLIPRFVDPDKLESQAGLNLLSIRYGLQTADATANTTIGWGVVAEAYANFGYTATISVGVLIGVLCGLLTRLSVGAAPLSLRMLITIVATLTMFNVELDLSYLITILAQSFAAVLLIAMLPKILRGRRRGAPAPMAASLHVNKPPFTEAPSRRQTPG
jgi:hypothetical protein